MKKFDQPISLQSDLSAIIKSLYLIADENPETAEERLYSILADKLLVSNGTDSELWTQSENLISAVQSLFPLQPAKSEFLNVKHEKSILSIIESEMLLLAVNAEASNEDIFLKFKVLLSSCRPQSSTVFIDGFVEHLQKYLDYTLIQQLERYWKNNYQHLHPLVVLLESIRLTRQFSEIKNKAINSSFIGLELFRQIGTPISIEVPEELAIIIGKQDFGVEYDRLNKKVLEFTSVNSIQLLAQIISFGKENSYGHGNALSLLLKNSNF